MDALGRWLIGIGIGVAVLGVVVLLLDKVPFLRRWGNLPGDIRYQSPGGRVTCFVPIVSSILLSLILTVVVNIVIRLLKR